jgi:hypothetical protein
MRRLTCLAALACCCSAPLPARADTITISGGALTAVGIFGFTSFTLTGEGDVPLIVEIESGGSSLLVVHEW